MLLRVTVQSWVLGPVDFKVAKTTKTFVYNAEKLTSTSTPHRNSICFFRGSTEEKKNTHNH